jgi:hypothetical protein
MKKIMLLVVTVIAMSGYIFAQVTPSDPQYQTLKDQGLIPQGQQVTPLEPVTAILPSPPGGSPMTGLFVPLDGTFTLAMGPNDDGSTAEIPLPFNFCLYGAPEAHMWINNNGNCSFDGPKFDYTSTGFPSASYIMVAPFWADVDTRSGFGQVWYKIEAHRVIVIWDQVGYYSQHGDKRNTFELIFTDGTAGQGLSGVNNVLFSYSSMEWTTGDFSGGSGGFGGTPATVGVNKGDGVKYALVGRFDHAGTDFDGAGGANDGVGYLTDKVFQFNACEETVIIPPTIPTLSEWALILLGVVLLGVGVAYIMKRQRANISI